MLGAEAFGAEAIGTEILVTLTGVGVAAETGPGRNGLGAGGR
jgi:hypothetical protein